jgi:hypothetical protein
MHHAGGQRAFAGTLAVTNGEERQHLSPPHAIAGIGIAGTAISYAVGQQDCARGR